jgi:hypothetical protein
VQEGWCHWRLPQQQLRGRTLPDLLLVSLCLWLLLVLLLQPLLHASRLHLPEVTLLLPQAYGWTGA